MMKVPILNTKKVMFKLENEFINEKVILSTEILIYQRKKGLYQRIFKYINESKNTLGRKLFRAK
ncbi:hypothetical protein GCM10009865_44930 [Aeromicrobium ponti]|uniref:Uncharacterized protein n=1 Tax=Cytobacillus oceanisediminis TaxID=665099 RepID=A0A562JEL3_9BACI|nr:hypothetical protein IQ19_04327 [Cytobacillus oceanisediminis]